MKNMIAAAVIAVSLCSAPAWAKNAAKPVPEPATAAELDKAFASTSTVVLHGIVFGAGRATVTPDSRPVLGEIGKFLALKPDFKLSIEVHTDSSGKYSANLELSKRRAMALRDALIKRGVAAKRLSWEGYGDAKPLANNATPKGKAQNRRVELVKK